MSADTFDINADFVYTEVANELFQDADKQVSLDAVSEIDVLKFDVMASESITATSTPNAAPGLDIKLVLRDPNSTIVSTVDANGAGASETIANYVTLLDGTYSLEVHSVSGTGLVDNDVDVDTNIGITKHTASDAAASDWFSAYDSIDVSNDGQRMIVGAFKEDTPGPTDSGSAYIYEKQGDGSWLEVQKVTASDAASGDYFGYSVAIDGDYAVIGALYEDNAGGSNAGSAYVFKRNAGTGVWEEKAKLTASDGAADDYLGVSVAISGDFVVVGAYGDDPWGGNQSGSAYVFERQTDDTWDQTQQLLALDGYNSDRFGMSVAIDANRIAVGAYYDDTSRGAVYVFDYDGTSWFQKTKLTASDRASHDRFAYGIDLWGDRVIAGSYNDDDNGTNSGSAYIYELQSDETWLETKIKPLDGAASDSFGYSVSINGDRAVIGANLEDEAGTDAGAAYVFVKYPDGAWRQADKLTASSLGATDYFGAAVALSEEDIVVGARGDDDGGTDAGAIYTYSLSDLNAPPVAASYNHSTDVDAVLNVNSTDGVLKDARDDDADTMTASLVVDVAHGTLVLNSNGSFDYTPDAAFMGFDSFTYKLNDGTTDSNVATVYLGVGPVAKVNGSLVGAGDQYGYSVDISKDGTRMIVGAYLDDEADATNEGSAYIYEKNLTTGEWEEKQKLLASNGGRDDWFGYSVAIEGDYAIVGAHYEDTNGGNAGAAYIFIRNTGTGVWEEKKLLTASDGAANDYFGISVNIDGERAVVGASLEDNNGSVNDGAVYVFDRVTDTQWDETKLIAADAYSGLYFGNSVAIDGDRLAVGAYGDPSAGTRTGSVYVFDYDGTAWIQTAELIASDAASNDRLGAKVALWGDRIIAGSYNDDDNGTDSGSAYIFERQADGSWAETKVKASDGAASDRFGISVAIFADRAVVGAYTDDNANGTDAGAAYVYEKQLDGSWSQTNKMVPAWVSGGERFGVSVAMNADDVLVGADKDNLGGPAAGSSFVYIYDLNNSPPVVQEQAHSVTADTQLSVNAASGVLSDATDDEGDALKSILVSDATFGTLDLAIDGSFTYTPDPGFIGIDSFEFKATDGKADSNDSKVILSVGSGTILQGSTMGSEDLYGHSVSMSRDGTRMIVGAYKESELPRDRGAAYVYERNVTTDAWEEKGKLIASDAAIDDWFAHSVSIDGDYAIAGAHYDDDNGSYSGSAYVFYKNQTTGVWEQQAKLTASDAAASDYFGLSVSIDGSRVVVGAYSNDGPATNTGAIYVFDRSGTTWTETVQLTASDAAASDHFGYAVSLDGDRILTGAHDNDDNGSRSGSAYIFDYDTGTSTWSESQKITASDGAATDLFGITVDVHGDHLIVGAYLDDDAGSSSGSAYVFEYNTGTSTWEQKAKLTASNAAAGDYFGRSVGIHDDRVLVGANLTDTAGTDSGSAYLFQRDSGGTWNQVGTLAADTKNSGDNFGVSVSIGAEDVVIGASKTDSAGPDAGAAYAFDIGPENTAPSITGNTFNLAENSAVGTDVGTVAGTDADTGQTLKHEITAGNELGAFSIVESSGLIEVANPAMIDYETTPTFTLTVKVTDNGYPSFSDTATVTVNLTNVNEGPKLQNNYLPITEGATLVLSANHISTIDPDTADSSLTFTVSVVTNGQFELVANPTVAVTTFTLDDIKTSKVQFVHDGSDAAASYKVSVSDGTLSDGPEAGTVIHTESNDNVVTVATVIPNQVANENSSWVFQVPNGTFSDLDNDSALTLSMSVVGGTPSWMNFSGRTFYGNVPSGLGSTTYSIDVTASDGTNQVTDQFDLSFTDAGNGDPTATYGTGYIADQAATEDDAFTFTVDDDVFDSLKGSPTSFAATKADDSALPSWLSFNTTSREFTGTPGTSDIGTVSVKVTGTYADTSTATGIFDIVVSAKNAAPTVASAIADQYANKNGPFEIEIPLSTFTDGDGDRLKLTVSQTDDTALPAWLKFDGTTLRADAASTTIDIKVTADDGFGNTVTDTFKLNVIEQNSSSSTQTDSAYVATGKPFSVTFSTSHTDAVFSAKLASGSDLPSGFFVAPDPVNNGEYILFGDSAATQTIRVDAHSKSNLSTILDTYDVTLTALAESSIKSLDGYGTEVKAEISVFAVDAYAAESDEGGLTDDGQFLFTISDEDGYGSGYGALAYDLDIHYMIERSSSTVAAATDGDVDETLVDRPGPMTGKVTLLANTMSVALDITPDGDDIVEWDETIKLKLIYGEITDDGFGGYGTEYKITSKNSGTVTIFDDEEIGGLINRNVDAESIGEGSLTFANHAVSVDAHDGLATLTLPVHDGGFGPAYFGDDNLYPIFTVDTFLPGQVDVSALEASALFGGVVGSAQTYDVTPIDNVDDDVTFVDKLHFSLAGPDMDDMYTGHYDYDIDFKATVDGDTRHRTIRSASEIVNRLDDTVGDDQFGNRWWVEELDSITPGDGTLVQHVDEGRATESGMALVRGDASTAWYATTTATDTTVIDDVDPTSGGYSRTGSDWEDGPYSGGYSGDYQVSGTSSDTAKWSFSSLSLNRQYQVFATWVPGADRTSLAEYKVTGAKAVVDGLTTTTVEVDQRYTPGEVTISGAQWRSLGFFTLESGGSPLDVVLSNLASGELIADAVMVVGDWEFATPAGSFTDFEHGDYEGGEGLDVTDTAHSPAVGDYTLLGKWGNRYEFDYEGNIVLGVDRNLNQTVFEYDANGLIDKITDVYGLVSDFTFVGGELDKITDFASRDTSYTHTSGMLTKITEPNPGGGAPEIEFTYETEANHWNLKTVTDQRDQVITLNYDSTTKRISSVNDIIGSLTPYVSDGLGSILSAPGGDPTETGVLRQARATHDDGRSSSDISHYQVDGFGRATAIADQLDAIWLYERTGDGLVTKMTEPAGGGGDRATADEFGKLETSYEYDTKGNLKKATYAQEKLDGSGLLSESWTHDDKTSQLKTHVDGRGNTTTWTLDSHGNATSIAYPEGVSESIAYHTISSTSGDPGDVLPGGLIDTHTDARGFIFDFDYITAGATIGLILTKTRAKTTADESITHYTYDTKRNLDTKIQQMGLLDSPGNGETDDRLYDSDYDALNRLTKMTLPSAVHDDFGPAVTTDIDYEYFDDGLLKKMTDQLDRVTEYEYDIGGRLTKTTLPQEDHLNADWTDNLNAKPVINQTWDGIGNLLTVEDPLTRKVINTFDSRGNLSTVTLPATVDHGTSVTTYTYDTLGNVATVTDALGRVAKSETDKLGRVIKTTAPAPNVIETTANSTHAAAVTELFFDDNGNAVGVLDSLSRVHKNEFDGLNRLWYEQHPDPASGTDYTITRRTYDAAGNVVGVLDAEFNFTETKFDALNRVSKVILPATKQHGAPETTFKYNDASQQTKLIEKTPSGTRETVREYDNQGRLVKVSEPTVDGKQPVTEMVYDKTGKLRRVKDAEDKYTAKYYDALNRLTHTAGANFDNGAAPDLNATAQALYSSGYSVSEYEYDIAGQQLRVTEYVTDASSNQANRVTKLAYDLQGRQIKEIYPLVTTDDGAGGTTTHNPEYVHHFDKVGNETSVVYKINPIKTLTTTNKYDDLNRLDEVTAPDPKGGSDYAITEYVYDAMNRTTKETNPNLQDTEYVYDDLDRVKEIKKHLLTGQSVKSTTKTIYNKVNQVVATIDEDGKQTDITRDELQQVIKVERPSTSHYDIDLQQMVTSRATEEMTYDILRRQTSHTDALDHVSYTIFNDHDLVTTTVGAEVGGKAPIETNAYNLVHNRVSHTDAEGNVTRSNYNNQHMQTETIQEFADPNHVAIDKIVDDQATAGNGFDFDGPGSWTEVTTAGHNSDYHYIASGTGTNKATWTFSDLTPGHQYEVMVTWEVGGSNATDSPFSVFDGVALELAVDIDQTVAPEDDLTESGTTWQSLGIFTFSDGTASVELTDDADGQVVADAVRLIELGPTTVSTFNENGEVISTTDALGRTTTYEHDDNGRVNKTVHHDPDGSGPQIAPVETVLYDLYGQVVSSTNGEGEKWLYGYDDLQRKTSETDSNGDVVTYGFDKLGNMTTVTDAVGNVTTYGFDEWNRKTSETIKIVTTNYTQTFAYDDVSNLTKVIDKNGRVFVYNHDNEDRQITERWYLNDTDATADTNRKNTIDTVFDKQSRVFSMDDDFSKYVYSYDDLNRITSVDNTGTAGVSVVVFNYTYDDQNRLTSTKATVGGTADYKTVYTYNGRNLLESIEQDSQAGGNAVAYKRADYIYDVENQLDQLNRFESTGVSDLVASTSFAWDLESRLTGMTHAKGSNVLAGYSYTHDAANRIESVNSHVDGVASYRYDDRGQLAGADYENQQDEAYTYDANGNRVIVVNNDNITQTTYTTPSDERNRLKSDGTYNYTYDDQGNRNKRTKISDSSYTNYTWDVRNRLTKVENFNSSDVLQSSVDNIYDMYNRWIGKDVDSDGNGTTDVYERYVWDNNQIALQFNDENSDGDAADVDELTHRYLWAGTDSLLADEKVTAVASEGNNLWALNDHLGTSRDVVDYDDATDTTTVKNHRTFDAFGNVITESDSSVDQLFGFQGKPFESISGLQFHGQKGSKARWYYALAGDWMSNDMIGFASGDANLYRAFGNDPVNSVDPTGEFEIDWEEARRTGDVYITWDDGLGWFSSDQREYVGRLVTATYDKKWDENNPSIPHTNQEMIWTGHKFIHRGHLMRIGAENNSGEDWWKHFKSKGYKKLSAWEANVTPSDFVFALAKSLGNGGKTTREDFDALGRIREGLWVTDNIYIDELNDSAKHTIDYLMERMFMKHTLYLRSSWNNRFVLYEGDRRATQKMEWKGEPVLTKNDLPKSIRAKLFKTTFRHPSSINAKLAEYEGYMRGAADIGDNGAMFAGHSDYRSAQSRTSGAAEYGSTVSHALNFGRKNPWVFMYKMGVESTMDKVKKKIGEDMKQDIRDGIKYKQDLRQGYVEAEQ